MAEPQLRWSIGANDNSKAAFNSFTANIRKGQAEMRAFTAASDTGFARFTANLRRGSAELSGFTNHIRGMAAGFATIIGADFAKRAVEEIGNLGEAAQKAGVSVADLQKLVFAGIGTGASQDSIVGMMEQFNRRIGEAATKGGELKDLLSANGVALRDNNGQITDSVTLLTRVADLVKNARSEQEKAVIAMMAFGRGGAESIPFLNQGGDAIRRLMQNAVDAGYVIKTDMVDRADEFGDRWTAAATVFKRVMAVAATDIALELDSLIKPAIELDDFLRRTTGKGLTATPLSDIMFPERKTQRARDENQAQIDELERQAGERRAAIAEFNRVYPAVPGMTREMTIDETELQDIERQIAALRDQRKALGAVITAEDKLRTDRMSAGDKATEVPQKAADSHKRAAKATDEHRAAIERLNDALRVQKEQQDKLADSMDEFRDGAREGLGEVVDILKDGKIEAKELGDLLTSLGSKLINRGLDRFVDAALGKQGTTEPGFLGKAFPELFPERPTMTFPSLPNAVSRNPYELQYTPYSRESLVSQSKLGPVGSTGVPFLDLIGQAEGTDRGRGYNETLDYGRWTGGNRNLVGMSLDEIDALQRQMIANPANRALYGNGQGSSALGRYQITGRTLRGLRGQMGLSGDELFDPAMQDRLALQLAKQRGPDVGGLRNEWEGLRNVPGKDILSSFNQSSERIASNFTTTMSKANVDVAGNFGSVFEGLFSGTGGGAASSGGGGFMSILQTLLQALPMFAGGFAEGGNIPAGKWGIVGERGIEIAKGGSSGMDIIPMDAMPARRGGARNNIVIGGATININGSADEQTVAMIDRRLAEHSVRQQAQLDRRINRIAQRNNAYYA